MADKYQEYFELLNKWLLIKNYGKTVLDHVGLKDKKKIAVYGIGKIGKRLVEEIECRKGNIAYAIDKNADMFFADFEIYKPDDELPKCDVIVVTAILEYDVLYSYLSKKTDADILSLKTLIEELWVETIDGNRI